MGLTISHPAGASRSNGAFLPTTPSRATVSALPVSSVPAAGKTPRSLSSIDPSSTKGPSSSSSGSLNTIGGNSHPTSPRAGGKLEQVKTTILEDPKVLRDAQWCAAFIRYLTEAYAADLLGGNHDPQRVKLARKMQTTSRVFFDFWADLSDLEWCHAPSDFRSLRLEAILEKYLSRGAETPVPLSESVRISLLGEDGSGDASQEALKEARDEAFRYLASEVLPFFVRSESPLGLPACLYKTKRVVWTLEDAAKKITAYPDTMNLCVRVASSQAFHAYMKAKDETLGHMVMTTIEILGFKSLADHWGLQRWRQKHKAGSSEADPALSPRGMGVEMEALLQRRFEITTAHDIFDSHLRLGQAVRAMLPSSVVQTLLSDASSGSVASGGGALPTTLFDEILVYLLNHLNGHLLDFYQSEQHARLKQAPELSARSSPELLQERRQELSLLLGSMSLRAAFASYLAAQEDPQAAWLLKFYQEVVDLQACASEMPLSVFGRVIKIFLTYVRRGAPCELVVLGGAPRIQAIERLIKPGALGDGTVYDPAFKFVVDELACQWLPNFSPGAWLTQEAETAATPLPDPSLDPPPPSRIPLSTILGSATALAAFRTFAVAEFLINPVHFWVEAENYRTLPRQDLMVARARTIVKKYIAPDAPRAVPLSESVKERVLACCRADMCGPGLFLESQTQVYQWMEAELFPRFVRTPAYQALAARLQTEDDKTPRLNADMQYSGSLKAVSGAGSARMRSWSGDKLRQQRASNDSDLSTSARISTADDMLDVLSHTNDADRVRLLTRLLEVPIARQFFREYCRERGACKHLAFWLDAEEFRRHLVGNHAFRRSQARKLAGKYIKDDAVMKVPIKYTTQQQLLTDLDLESPSHNPFKQAQEEVLSYMATDLLPGFLDSPELKTMMKANAIIGSTPWAKLNRRLGRIFRKTPSKNDLLGESGTLGSARSHRSESGSPSTFGTSSSSSLSDMVGFSLPTPHSRKGDLSDRSNWTARLSASFRMVLLATTGLGGMRGRVGARQAQQQGGGQEEVSPSAHYRQPPPERRRRRQRSTSLESSSCNGSERDSGEGSLDGEESADLTTDSVISNLRSSSYRMEAASPPSPRSGLASPSSPPRSPSWRGPVRGVPVLPLQDSGVSSADTQES